MSDPVETKQCSNCKLEILLSNYTVHCLHCVKNIYLCDKCEHPVNHNQKIDHDQANHVLVFCSNCNIKLEKYLLGNHLDNDCPYRKIKCQICGIEVTATDISEHEIYCGARTEKCAECGEYVMFKYKSLHVESNHTFIKLSDEPGPSPSWQNGRRTLDNFMPDLTTKKFKHVTDHSRKSNEFHRRCRNLESNESGVGSSHLETSKKNFDSTQTEKDKLHVENFSKITDIKSSPKKNVDEWPALSSFRGLQISEEKESNPTGTEASKSSENEESDLMYAIQVSQELNSQIWAKGSNTKSEEAFKNSFKPLAKNHLLGEKVVNKSMFDENIMEESTHLEFTVSRNHLDYVYDEQDNVKLPCEFCGMLIISNVLNLHQSRCSLNMTKPYNRGSTRHRLPYFDENDEDNWEKRISCPMCNKVLKASLLEIHDPYCKGNTTKPWKSHDKGGYSRSLRYTNVRSEPSISNSAEPTSSKLHRSTTETEWFSELSKNRDGKKDLKKNLNCPETGGSSKTVKASRKNKKAPSPPRR